MIIDTSEKPFPFLMVRDFYNEEEQNAIWQELDFLTQPGKLLPGIQSNNFKEDSGEYRKKCQVQYLDFLYKQREVSNILRVNRKVCSPEITDEFTKLCFGYNMIKHCDSDFTVVNYYETSDYYKPHNDTACYTALTWFYKEPKKFSGGDFRFTDYDYTIEIEHNMMILFPSFVNHEVSEVSLEDNSSNYGRYVISQFIRQMGTNAT
jgi:Rps23 Pro-64 3,4-dihydroxylase Tpa1-like proline 4-hydroxylase